MSECCCASPKSPELLPDTCQPAMRVSLGKQIRETQPAAANDMVT